MDYAAIKNLPAMFFERAAHYGDREFLWAKRDGAWRPLSWNETAARVIQNELDPADDDGSLSVSGIDPIEFSSSWIKFILGIVAAATENRGLFNK